MEKAKRIFSIPDAKSSRPSKLDEREEKKDQRLELLGRFASECRFLRTLVVKLQNGSMTHESINSRPHDHRVLEDLVPFRKNQITADEHTTSLVALRQESKEDIYLLKRC